MITLKLTEWLFPATCWKDCVYEVLWYNSCVIDDILGGSALYIPLLVTAVL